MTNEKAEKIQYVVKVLKKQFQNEQFHQFIDWLFLNHFFDHIEISDLDWYEKTFYLPLLKVDNIAIGMEINKDFVLVGIDPSKCFDSLKRSSILISFPMSKREYRLMEKHLDKLLDKKSSARTSWLQEAPAMFYGKYARFGNVAY